MILVDTSVWVEWLGRGVPARDITKELPEIVTSGPIIQEVFQGLDDSRPSANLRSDFLAIPRLEDPLPLDLFREAAEIFRVGRRKGYSVRSTVDCLVAAIAIRHDAVIWHKDRDYTFIARYTKLDTMSWDQG